MSIWSPASKKLDFDEIFKRFQLKGVEVNFIFEESFRALSIPLTQIGLLGELFLVELYLQGNKDYFFCHFFNYSDDKFNGDFFVGNKKVLNNSNSGHLMKFDALTGDFVCRGTGFVKIMEKISFRLLATEGIPIADIEEIMFRFIPDLEKFLTLINFEVKQTIRSNAENFISSIV